MTLPPGVPRPGGMARLTWIFTDGLALPAVRLFDNWTRT